MKTLTLLLLLLSCFLVTCRQQNEPTGPVELPITLVNGYGPFHPGFGSLGNEHKNDPEWKKFWGKLTLPVKGIPKNWSNVDKSMVWLNTHQLIYQNFLAGNFTQEQYESLQKSWKWSPDTAKLSEKPIKCYVYTITGFDEKIGKWGAMIDTNNNLDFSDEKAVYPKVIDNKDPYSYQNPTIVQYEIYRRGKVVKATVPMVVKTMGSEFLYNFPQHAQATLSKNGKNYSVAVISGFMRTDFESPSLVDISSVDNNERVFDDKLTKISENIVLGGIRYKNKGVDVYTNTLRLEPVDDEIKEYSLQVGYPFRPFSAQEFTTKRPIALADYKGKYVYIDFWGTWCAGCVQDIPSLRKMYREINKTRFEFIGIAADSPDKLTKFINEEHIKWPQIVSDNSNKLVDTYSVTGFPTSVLLDPNGIVIARNLRGEELAVKLKELGN